MDLQQKYSKICEVICNGYDIVKSLQILRILCISAGKVPCIFCAGNELYAVIHAMWIKRGGREKMVYNILDYGAVGDGKTKCTQAIQAAVDDCAKTGGQVYVPAGDFLSGTVCLRSEVELHLESGAVLRSSLDPADMKDYTGGYQDDNRDSGWEGGCFLYACHERDITISGDGVIDGQGALVFYDDDADHGKHECPLNIRGFRPRMTFLEDVENLTVKGVTFRDAAFWTLHMAGCRNVLVEGVRILNNDRGPNNDGIDPDCCRNVVIRGCVISGGDDSIVVKATGPMHRKYGDCEDIVITGCILHSRSSALKIGTETHGSIRHVILSDCVIRDSSRGIGIWSRDGGEIADIHVHHVTGNTLRYADGTGRSFSPAWWGKGEPVFISATKRAGTDRLPGRIREIYMDHISMTSECSIVIAGEEYAPVEHVQLQDMDICWKRQGTNLPEVLDEQPSAYGCYPHEIPCIYLRHAEDVNISGRLQVDPSLQEVITKREIHEGEEKQ